MFSYKHYIALFSKTDGWEKTSKGDPSNSGTTVSCILVQHSCIYVANVGDSTVVFGNCNPKFGKMEEKEINAKVVTNSHKPDNMKEKSRIESLGGKIMTDQKGVNRVVWQRMHRCNETGVSHIELIPYLNVCRSLGDLWSSTEDYHNYLISPVPDVSIFSLDHNKHNFIVLASDGMWDMLSPQETVDMINDLRKETNLEDIPAVLINAALERWSKKNSPADNISVIIGFFNITASVDCSVGKSQSHDTDNTPAAKRTCL